MSPPPVPNPAKIMHQYKKQNSAQILAIKPQTELAGTVRDVVVAYSRKQEGNGLNYFMHLLPQKQMKT